MKIARKVLVVAIVVLSVLATVLCTERWINVSKRQLRQLKKLAADQQQPLEEKKDLGMENRQDIKSKTWNNARLQREVQALQLTANSMDTSITNMKPDFRR